MAAPGLAVVTGASSGIGRGFAESLAARGHAVLLIARREERLRELAEEIGERHGVPAEVCVADLSTDEGRARARAAVDASTRPVEVVVLNAGFGTRGALASLDAAREVQQVQLNCIGVVDLGLHVLPGLVGRGRGDVIVLSSAAAFLPIPHMATYAATKAFELRWTEALWSELRGTGVRAIAVCPGPTRTEFTTGAPEGRLYRLVPQDSVESVIEATWRGLERGKRRVATGAISRLSLVASRLVPKRILLGSAGAVRKPPGQGPAGPR